MQVIKALLDCLQGYFALLSSKSENEPVHTVVKDKKELEKAAFYTEKMIDLIYKKAIFKTKFAKLRFNVLVKKFRKAKN